MSQPKNRLNILNVWVDPVDMAGALERIERFVEEGDRPHSVFAVNPEKNFSVPRDPRLHQTFKQADLLIPDGIGVVMAARILHRARLSRVPGVELMDRICRLSAGKGYRVFIYGAKEEVSSKAAAILQQRYPSLKIVGRANGFVTPDEIPSLIERINASGAQILFLALGSPRQENWFVENAARLSTVRVCQGIGGTLDTIAGTVKRAPERWCRLNLEWLYRLISEPKRIGRQKVLPIFAYRVFRRKLSMVFV
ncbi:WecB/TagA/CpsF family glycosyltransferase [Geobacter argillaceus]|uniref:N-acetylglucosaminyldiphosphoundecaprenol N-acetyl-beta-D-mannosaminyltransferase n=1 Tax=Geobacter argillaceus TaxID=345631 RepID=A0A562VM66_9BACT|nr:WecB/TagA/CpsF family glycosyltransferase [Geobacter argillaceus]TWJ19063.1 N-acetylglucosaminyldiphosphoundecaprenol N-acetyl-beta-D-mannosaminyltransferase [Geobacter argillaceus]